MRAAVLLALSAVVSPGALATESGMRCQGGLISIGYRQYEVQQKCGPATFADRRVEDREADDGSHFAVTVDEWVYDFGPQQFVRTLLFENGKLVRIKVGDYGSPSR